MYLEFNSPVEGWVVGAGAVQGKGSEDTDVYKRCTLEIDQIDHI